MLRPQQHKQIPSSWPEKPWTGKLVGYLYIFQYTVFFYRSDGYPNMTYGLIFIFLLHLNANDSYFIFLRLQTWTKKKSLEHGCWAMTSKPNQLIDLYIMLKIVGVFFFFLSTNQFFSISIITLLLYNYFFYNEKMYIRY